MFRYEGIDQNGTPRVFGQDNYEQTALGLCKEEAVDYVKRRPALKSETKFESAKPNPSSTMKLVEFRFSADKPKPSKITVMLSPSENAWRVERIVAD